MKVLHTRRVLLYIQSGLAQHRVGMWLNLESNPHSYRPDQLAYMKYRVLSSDVVSMTTWNLM